MLRWPQGQGHRSPVSQLHHCWVYYNCFLLLGLHWHYSCTASIMLCNPHCSHRGHTIVLAWYTVKALTPVWNKKSMKQTLSNQPWLQSSIVLKRDPAVGIQLGAWLRPYLIWAHVCSLIKCSSLLWVARLKRWNAWGPTEHDLNKAPGPDGRPNSCSPQVRPGGGSWTQRTLHPNCTALLSVHSSQSTDNKNRVISYPDLVRVGGFKHPKVIP